MTGRIAMIVLACASTASAQYLVNGDFELGTFSPWVVASTPSGTSVVTAVSMYDIDGPGPAPLSRAASFMVGRSAPVGTAEGVAVSQLVQGIGGIEVRVTCNWSVHALVNVYNAGGGIFELLVDGQVIGQAAAPVMAPGQFAYGQVTGTFQSPVGSHTIGVRITRNIPAGEEVFQYVDDIRVSPACYANCDYSSVPPVLNANDFQCFLGAYASQYAYANCDGSTAPPVLNANDFLCFLNKFAAGCM